VQTVDELATAKVYSVEFVATYLSLHLDRETDVRVPGGYAVDSIHVNVIEDSIIEQGNRRWMKSDAGWRDALCELIFARVTRAETDGRLFRMHFDNGAMLSVPVHDNAWPESVTIHSKTTTWVL
jgi:hypothetical protein